MNDAVQGIQCRCGAQMEEGYTTALGLLFDDQVSEHPKLAFVVLGEQTSRNPIKAFKQGLDQLPARRAYGLRGYRCAACGRVELIANDSIAWPP
jgi:hypothetical protein